MPPGPLEPTISARPVAIEAARLRLADLILSLANADTRDPLALKDEAGQAVQGEAPNRRLTSARLRERRRRFARFLRPCRIEFRLPQRPGFVRIVHWAIGGRVGPAPHCRTSGVSEGGRPGVSHPRVLYRCPAPSWVGFSSNARSSATVRNCSPETARPSCQHDVGYTWGAIGRLRTMQRNGIMMLALAAIVALALMEYLVKPPSELPPLP
jgi:hypothetical protein